MARRADELLSVKRTTNWGYCRVVSGGYPPVTTFPGNAVGAAGAKTDGVNEFGPPGVRVGAFSVGDAGGPPGGGAGELADGDGAPEVLVGSGVSDGVSLSLPQPAVMAAIPTMATPPSNSPTRQDTSREFIRTPSPMVRDERLPPLNALRGGPTRGKSQCCPGAG